MRAEELVRRAHEEVRAEGCDVDRGVRREMHAVDVYERADLVRALGDAGDVWPRAEHVRRAGHGDEPRALVHDVVEFLVEAQIGGLGVEREPPHGRPDALGRLHPRAHVGIVVELGDDDLIARAPRLRKVTREVVRELRGATPVDDAARVGAHEVGSGSAEGGDGIRRVLLRERARAAIRERSGERRGDRLAHDRGRLRAAGPVEVGDTGGERGEPAAQRGDVERGHPLIMAAGPDASGRRTRGIPSAHELHSFVQTPQHSGEIV